MPPCQYGGLLLRKGQAEGIRNTGTGCLVDAAIGPYQGKDTNEIVMLRLLLSSLKAGDVVVADRHFCGYSLIAMLMEKGIHVCFRKHQARHTDFASSRLRVTLFAGYGPAVAQPFTTGTVVPRWTAM